MERGSFQGIIEDAAVATCGLNSPDEGAGDIFHVGPAPDYPNIGVGV